MYARAANMFKMAKNWSGMHKSFHNLYVKWLIIFSKCLFVMLLE